MASRGKFGKAALLMGAAAVAAGVLLKRDKVQALLNPGGSDSKESSWAPAQPPEPSNYDAPGPPANTATPVPAPDAQILEEDGSIDEAAEEAAAAAEAANIGGQVSDYAGIVDPDEPATEAERPLVESGEGSSEGEEQAEAELAEAAAPSDGMSDFERQIDDAIEEQSQPFSGETLEPVSLVEDPPGDAEMRAAETAAAADMAEAETETVEAAGAGAHAGAGARRVRARARPGARDAARARRGADPGVLGPAGRRSRRARGDGGDPGGPRAVLGTGARGARRVRDLHHAGGLPARGRPGARARGGGAERAGGRGPVRRGHHRRGAPTTPGTPPTASWQPPAPPEPTPRPRPRSRPPRRPRTPRPRPRSSPSCPPTRRTTRTATTGAPGPGTRSIRNPGPRRQAGPDVETTWVIPRSHHADQPQ